jgi:hypothetical protein
MKVERNLHSQEPLVKKDPTHNLYDDLYLSQKRRDYAKLKMLEYDSLGRKEIAKLSYSNIFNLA